MVSTSIKNKLTADVLNKMTVHQTVLTLTQINYGLKFLPLCPSDHRGVTDNHKKSCSNPGKVPLIAKWLQKASNDPAILDGWFKNHSTRNLGMIMGGDSGIIGFDIDGEYGQTKMEELFDGDIPLTWKFSTPGGGSRYLFHIPEGIRLRKLADVNSEAEHEELALLADGQMTVIPPSRHQNGGQYLWVKNRGPGDLPLADLPQNVLKQLMKGQRNKQSALTKVSSLLSSKAGSSREIAKPMHSLTGEGKLQRLSTKCKVMKEALSEQQLHGCSETQWLHIVSMLVRGGFSKTALTFSQLSQKHDHHSEDRIRKLNAERPNASYGPTRCVTLGCDLDQIAKCHSNVSLEEDTHEPKNSPVTLLLSATTKKTISKKLTSEDYIHLMGGNHVIHNNSLCKARYKKEGETEHVQLANFVARIVKFIVKDNGTEKNAFYEIDGLLVKTQRSLPSIHVPAQDFESMKWITMWGPEPTLYPGYPIRDLVRFAIQSTSSAAIREQIYTHLGWINLDDKWTYLHAGGALNMPNVKVELETRLQNYNLSNFNTSNTKAMEASLKLLDVAPHRVTLVLWALTYLSPLCEWLRMLGIEPKFLVWLHGYTGSRKTTLAKLFLCHFGNLLEHPPASFKDTANSVEKRGFDTKDSLLLIDDYHPTTSPREKNSMETLAQQILRGYGDRVGRGRMKQDTSLRPDYPPRGNALVTAEDLISGGSSVARLFPAELLKTDVNLPLLTKAQDNFEYLRVAMKGYLEWVGLSMSKPNHKELRQLFNEKRKAASHLGVHGRMVEAAVWLYLGLDSGLEYAESVGAVTAEMGDELRSEGWNVFLEIAKEQGQQVTDIKPSSRFLNIVSQLLANQSIHCNSVHQDPVPKTLPNNSALVGWQDENFFFFLPELIYNEVSQFLSKRGERFPITSNTLWKELADSNLIQTEVSKEKGKERRHFLMKKTVKKQRQRLLWVKKAALHDEVEPTTKNKTREETLVTTHDAEEFDPMEGF